VKALLLLVLAASPASARPVHGSASAGGSLLGTGEGDGSRLRADVEIDVET